MPTYQEVVREYFPKLTDKQVEGVLWAHTGFPSFWPEGLTPEQALRKQLQELKDAQ